MIGTIYTVWAYRTRVSSASATARGTLSQCTYRRIEPHQGPLPCLPGLRHRRPRLDWPVGEIQQAGGGLPEPPGHRTRRVGVPDPWLVW